MQIALFVDPLKRTPQRGIAWKKELSLAAVDRDLKNLGVLAHVIVTECVILHVNAAEDDEIVAAFITELAETGIFATNRPFGNVAFSAGIAVEFGRPKVVAETEPQEAIVIAGLLS